jgi:hypothetical protein
MHMQLRLGSSEADMRIIAISPRNPTTATYAYGASPLTQTGFVGVRLVPESGPISLKSWHG